MRDYLEIHENLRRMSHLPKDQVEPYNPDCEVQKLQLQSNKQHELQAVAPVKWNCNNSDTTSCAHYSNDTLMQIK